jgi:ABC-type multidrug transport system permease subunit
MIRLAVVRRLARTALSEFLRTPEAVFWTYGFPVLMAVVLGIAFGGTTIETGRVVVVASDSESWFVQALRGQTAVEFVVQDAALADATLMRGRADVMLSGSPDKPVLTLDPGRPTGDRVRRLVEDALQRHAGRADPIEVEIREDRRPGRRYIDFLIPGLIGLNILGSGLWGIGFTLVDFRSKKLLRRLVVTPMRRAEFLLGYVVSRMGLIVVDAFLIGLFGVLCFGVPVRGSLLALLPIVVLGGIAFAGLGLLVASRARTIEAVSGLMNLVLLPMWLLGGSFFANDDLGVLQPLVEAMPLTHFNGAFREVMLYDAGFGAAIWPCAFLAGFAAVCFAVALKIFRWA